MPKAQSLKPKAFCVWCREAAPLAGDLAERVVAYAAFLRTILIGSGRIVSFSTMSFTVFVAKPSL